MARSVRAVLVLVYGAAWGSSGSEESSVARSATAVMSASCLGGAYAGRASFSTAQGPPDR